MRLLTIAILLCGAPSAGAEPHPAVVRVMVPERGGASYGSGTLVDVHDRYGLVVTNWHVVCDRAGAPSVVFPDGFRSAAKVVKEDRNWDLAALVIWKPRVQPVVMADQAPRPGQWLAIAGYGGGPYRAAAGRCTQYVSPGIRFPLEMVEVSALARQGDSGGPIFNAQGELAGVLFGAGHGRTAGSYCGRVRSFLESVLPEDPGPIDSDGSLLADDSARAIELAALPQAARGPAPAGEQRRARPAAVQAARHEAAMRAIPGRQPALAATTTPAGRTPPGTLESESPEAQALTWADLAGGTVAEQFKTILAAVGALSILIHGIRRIAPD